MVEGAPEEARDFVEPWMRIAEPVLRSPLRGCPARQTSLSALRNRRGGRRLALNANLAATFPWNCGGRQSGTARAGRVPLRHPHRRAGAGWRAAARGRSRELGACGGASQVQGAALRAEAGPPVLLGEHVGIEVGDPLLALDGALQVLERIADVGLDRLPEEARVALGEIGRRLVAETLGDPGLGELVVEGVELARIERIGELADQVGRAQQPRLGSRSRRGRCPPAPGSG